MEVIFDSLCPFTFILKLATCKCSSNIIILSFPTEVHQLVEPSASGSANAKLSLKSTPAIAST